MASILSLYISAKSPSKQEMIQIVKQAQAIQSESKK